MAYIAKEIVEEARQMNLLTYLQSYEPDNLVRIGNDVYCTREHDSLKISNGMWYWWTQNIGGRTALDYLVKVKEMNFTDAVELILGRAAERPPIYIPVHVKEKKPFELPKVSYTSNRVRQYLGNRGIDRSVIDYCLKNNLLFESYPRHNAVFVGYDTSGKARYAMQRGCGNDFIGDVESSDKRYAFCVPSTNNSYILRVFESPIDLLSYASLLNMYGYDWHKVNMLSLSGVYKPNAEATELPRALEQYLKDHPNISKVVTGFDNDEVGRAAADAVCTILSKRNMPSAQMTVPKGKDYNDYLCILKGLPITHRQPHDKKAAKEEAAPAADSVPDRKTTEAVR